MLSYRSVLDRAGITSAHDEYRRHQRLVRIALTVLVVSVTAYAIVGSGFVDLHVYRTGGYAWLTGIGLYTPGFPQLVPGSPLPFIYPPLSAILFSPLYLLPWQAAKFVLTLASVLGLVATLVVTAYRVYGRRSLALVLGLGVAAAGLLFEPVRQTIHFGQINLILMGLVAVDCLLPRTRWPRGLLIGLAAAIKLTPAVFVLFFLVRRQYRAAAVTVASFAGFSLAGFALAPWQSLKYWFDFLPRTDTTVGVAYAFNQSYQAILHRVLGEGLARSAVWALLVAGTFVLAWVAARRARAAGDDVVALLAIACWAVLASPISWSHHWVWAAPAAVVLLRAGQQAAVRTRVLLALVGLVFVIGPHTFMPQLHEVELHWMWWQHLLGSSYVLVGLTSLIWLSLRRPAVERAPAPAAVANLS
ncbi:alpha-1,2-mannosyltransferase [Amycolatopsis marina]|uniref:Alpha-1,2-mannosyltransferase n=1 Tax=Amycolatopsis marina TaxID=490629 RepID=A0A1I0VI98_9PSEU|nr:glycosyltransferase 87 family protein [Amycolatopsis marina]SFA75286.1 alpha-1,2-mannosyltransferase [Amycolatopsis marina]